MSCQIGDENYDDNKNKSSDADDNCRTALNFSWQHFQMYFLEWKLIYPKLYNFH